MGVPIGCQKSLTACKGKALLHRVCGFINIYVCVRAFTYTQVYAFIDMRLIIYINTCMCICERVHRCVQAMHVLKMMVCPVVAEALFWSFRWHKISSALLSGNPVFGDHFISTISYKKAYYIDCLRVHHNISPTHTPTHTNTCVLIHKYTSVGVWERETKMPSGAAGDQLADTCKFLQV